MNHVPAKPESAAPAARIRLVIVDDSELVRAGLQSLLQTVEAIELVGTAADVRGALEVCARAHPDVVLLDIRLPDGTGIDACRQLLRDDDHVRVLFLTSSAEQSVVDDAIRAGAHGYLLKEINTPALVQAIRDVAAGQSILDPHITARVLELVRGDSAASLLASLSPQEQRVLAKIAEGLTNKEVGNALGLSEKTVKNYLASVFDKLQVTRRSQAAVYYTQALRKQ